jgi:hypothetical protein
VACPGDRATWSRLQARRPLVSVFILNSKNLCGIFPRIYFHHFLRKKDEKVFLLKNSVRFSRFISYMVRFWSKTMSKGLGKVDVFWIHHQHLVWTIVAAMFLQCSPISKAIYIVDFCS